MDPTALVGHHVVRAASWSTITKIIVCDSAGDEVLVNSPKCNAVIPAFVFAIARTAVIFLAMLACLGESHVINEPKDHRPSRNFFYQAIPVISMDRSLFKSLRNRQATSVINLCSRKFSPIQWDELKFIFVVRASRTLRMMPCGAHYRCLFRASYNQ